MNENPSQETTVEGLAPAAVASPAPLRPIPGAEVVGRGIKLIPRRPYELKDYLMEREESSTVYTGLGYYNCPGSCAVQESPPVHQGVALGKTVILESSEQLDSIYTLNRKVAAGYDAFSISAGGDYAKSVKTSTDSRFAVRTSFVPLWAVYMPNPTLGSVFEKLLDKLSERKKKEGVLFQKPHNRQEVESRKNYFNAIFNEYGTHYVTRAWVGGKATVNVIVAKSSDVGVDDIRMGLNASWGGSGASLDTQQKESRTKLLNKSQVVVWGEGGSTSLLAKMGALEDGTYEKWLDSVDKNPKVIEIEVKGIWTLFLDPAHLEMAKALKTAYEFATEFQPIRALVTVDWPPPQGNNQKAPKAEKILYIIRDGRHYALDLFDVSKKPSKEPLYGPQDCPLQEDNSFKPIDAAANLPPAPGLKSPNNQNLLYFFSGPEYLVYDPYGPKVELGSGSTEELLKKCVSAQGREVVEYLAYVKRPLPVDEALTRGRHGKSVGKGVVDTLVKRQVLLQEKTTGLVQDRRPIKPDWPGLTFPKVDAAFYWGSDTAYFFYLSQYVRFDTKRWKAFEGYPKKIQEHWHGVPFDRIDAAVVLGKAVYLFRNDEFVAYNMETFTVDPEYPRYLLGSYIEDWDIFG